MTSVAEQGKGEEGQKKASRASFTEPVKADNMTLDCAAKYRVALLTKPDRIEDNPDYASLVERSKLF